jgi:zinc transport system ATP-binding protein
MGEPSLQVILGERTVFSSDGKWLYPLFEFEEWLGTKDIDPKDLTLCDNIVGKAAALLIVRLQIRRVKAGVLSRLGEGVLKKYEVSYSCAEMVEKVLCRTEQELKEVEDPQEAHRILSERIREKQPGRR